MKKLVCLTASVFMMIFLMATIPTFACDPGDPDCDSAVQAWGNLYDEFQRNFGDQSNGGSEEGAGFLSMISNGENFAKVDGSITDEAKGNYNPSQDKAWSSSKMTFEGMVRHDLPGSGEIAVGGIVFQNSYAEKDLGDLYGMVGEAGTAEVEAQTTSSRPIDLTAEIATCGTAKLGFTQETNHLAGMATTGNQAMATHTGEDGNVQVNLVNQFGVGGNLGGMSGMAGGNADTTCTDPNYIRAWTNGIGNVDFTHESLTNGFTNVGNVSATERTGGSTNPPTP